jgi:phospholipase C
MASPVNPLEKINHVVVLMLENRSFDNLLGWLYDPPNDAPYNVVPADFNGLSGKNLGNPDLSGKLVPAGKTEDYRSPQPNPGEPYEDVYSQMYNVDTPVFANGMPPLPSTPPNMQGFIRNYAAQLKDPPKDPATIMNSVAPKTIPVLSALAHNYALCDNWFASIPTQTFCNRSFVHAGTSSGYVNNSESWPVFINNTTTIYDLLEEAKKSWKIYVGGWLLESFTLVTQKHLWDYARGQNSAKYFGHFKDFVADAKAGALPAYSFIEPIYFDSPVWGPHTDMHPECNPIKLFGASNLHRGEELLRTVYESIRNGPSWNNTLLLIVFDEHGGCYDHVPPPSAATGCAVAVDPDPPDPNRRSLSNFHFDLLGPRVPAIVVSAYTKAQTRLHDVFEHTSVLSTVVNRFDLEKNRLGRRQPNAVDLSGAINLEMPRTDTVELEKPHFSLFDDFRSEVHLLAHHGLLGAKHKPCSDLQKHALHAVALMINKPELHGEIDNLKTELEAHFVFLKHEAELVEAKIFKT